MIHKLSDIHPGAKLEDNVIVDSFAVIQDNVEIGEGTHIYSHAVIMSGTRLGKNCRVFPGAVVGAIPQDLKFEGEDSLAIIGDNTTIRECVTINRGTKASGKTIVGNNTLLMAYVHIAHDCIIGSNCVLANAVNLAGHVEIGDYTVIGGMSAVHQFTKISAHCMIGGGSLIGKDTAPYATIGRDLKTYFAGVNSIGLRRRGFSNESIQRIQDTYRILYQANLNTTQALEKIISDIPDSPEKTEIVDFVRNSERGIIQANS